MHGCDEFGLAFVDTNTYLSCQGMDSPTDNSDQRSLSMANVLTTGASFFAPAPKPSFLSRLFRVYLEARQRHANRAVEQYLAARGFTLTDDAERDIERILANGGRQP